MGATTAWSLEETDFPTQGTGRDKLAFAARYAMLASTEQGWQPWEVRFRDDFAELFISNGPAAEVLDPERRESMMACGAALQHLTLALRHFNCLGRMDYFPDLAQPDLVARIHLGCLGERDAQERRLFDAMTARPGHSQSWSAKPPIDDCTLIALSNASAKRRGWLEVVLNEASRRRLEVLTAATPRLGGDEIRFPRDRTNHPGDRDESYHQATGPRLLERFSRWRRPVIALKVRTSPPANTEPNSPKPSQRSFAVLKTKTDDKHGWVAAGQIMALLILRARDLGLSCAFFNRVLRQPSVREELRTGLGHKGFVQGIAGLEAGQPTAASLTSVTHTTMVTGNSVPAQLNA